jgi:hypothetical protein
VGGCDWIRAARWEKKEEEIGGERHRDLCPSEGTGARGTGDPAGPAASAATLGARLPPELHLLPASYVKDPRVSCSTTILWPTPALQI